MASRKTVASLCIVVMVVAGSFLAYQFYFASGTSACGVIAGGSISRSKTTQTTFGAVTEYRLPSVDRWPDAVTAAPDGSVWFAEQEVPGVAHLYPNNGTLVEYAWPGYPTPKPPDCLPSASVSGIAVWNGRVWAADQFSNTIIGIDPNGGPVQVVNTTGKADFPYWLAVGPDDALWFTSNNTPARLGRIQSDMTLSVVNLEGLGADEPLQLEFVNSTLAYMTALNQSANSTTHVCVCNGHVYSFDPSSASTTLTPTKVGGDFNLILPTSASYASGVIYVAQHGASNLMAYDLANSRWTAYPTSRVPWTNTTLPLLVEASDSQVWFNEHLANKIGLLNPSTGVLTEYSESDPPATNYTGVQNDLSIAASPAGLWFTSTSGNYVGFVNPNQDPGLHVTILGADSASLAPGANVTFSLKVTGTWSAAMRVSVSDSENYQSVPSLIRIIPSVDSIGQGVKAPADLNVTVAAGQAVRAGDYTVAVTITDGYVQQTAYLFITVD